MEINLQQIPLTQGRFALVDDEDFEYLNQWKWYFDHGYARRDQKIEGKKRRIYMHREIIENSFGVDHKDNNRLNNQRSNLRSATQAQNILNTKKYKGWTSRFKGVSWHKKSKKWMAQIRASKKHFYLGLFDKEVDAYEAYKEAAIRLHGEFASL